MKKPVEPTWKTKAGAVPISELSNSHLCNAIDYVERKWWASADNQEAPDLPVYPDLIEEATKRGLLVADYEPEPFKPCPLDRSKTTAKPKGARPR